MPYACPGCGALTITARTEMCSRCRFVVQPRGTSTANAFNEAFNSLNKVLNIVLIVLVVTGILGVVAVKTVTFAVPRMQQAAVREKESEGVLLLRRAFELQHSYYDRNSAYASNLELLRPLGWKDPGTRSYSIRISSAHRDAFCLEADPVPDGRRTPPRAMSMNGDGFLFHQNGCTGNVDMRRSGIGR